MYTCFKCPINTILTINELILHLQIFHNLTNQSLCVCNQNNCVMDFRGFNKFRKHLNRDHSIVYNDSNSKPGISTNLPKTQVPENSEVHNPSINNIILDPNTSDIDKTYENKIDEDFKNTILQSVMRFVVDLQSKPNVTRSLLQKIVTDTDDLITNGIINKLKIKLEPLLKSCDPVQKHEIDKLFEVLENPFSKLNTDHLRMKYLEDNNLFFKPQTINVGYCKEKKCVNGVEKLLMVPVEGHLLSLKKNLKSFFELPGVLKTAQQFLNNHTNPSVLSSFIDGSTWINMKSKFSDKTVFPIFLYYDDAEMGNPLGSHSGIHKIGCIYYTIPAFPPEYLSSLDNVFVAFLFHSSDRSRHKISNKKMFRALIKELIEIQEYGIQLSNNITIYFALGLVLGDNLGLNSILGFVESFSANHYCRICRSPKSDLKNFICESKLLRNKINYESDLIQANVSVTGLNERCIFNDVPNFHVTENIVCDFMHDVPEGVARYDMAVIINNLIKNNFFSIDDLNSRIELFDYGVLESKNRPPCITLGNLKNGMIIMSAAEMLCFVRYFGLIIGELVPLKCDVWNLYLTLRKIIDLCCARNVQKECAVQLDNLVAEHNRLYLLHSQSKLKPKFHVLTHYGRLLLKNGPIILTSSIRFEAKHKILKSISNSVPCRINLGHTLAYKIQLQMASRLLKQEGLRADLEIGPGQNFLSAVQFTHLFHQAMPDELKNISLLVSWCKYKGIFYKPGVVLTLEVNLDGCLFGKVEKILIGKSMIPYFIVKPLYSVGFNDHFYAHEVEDNTNTYDLIGYYVNQIPDSTPSVTRVLGDGSLYVTIRYAL